MKHNLKFIIISLVLAAGVLLLTGFTNLALIIAFMIILLQQFGISKLEFKYTKYKGLFKAYKEMYARKAVKENY